MPFYDIRPLTVRTIKAGDGSCGSAHHEVIIAGKGVCAKCGREQDYRNMQLRILAKRLKRPQKVSP